MSIEAMTYVLGLNVGDSTRKLVLLGYANHAHKDGTAAWASISTVAEYANCSTRTVQRHVAQLLADGHMREGDQHLVDHLPHYARPIVYEIAMTPDDRGRWREGNAKPGTRATAAEQGRAGGLKAADAKRGSAASDGPRDSLSPGGGDDLAPGPGDTDGTGGVSPASPEGVSPVTPPGDTGVTQTVLEPSTEPSVEPSDDSLRSSSADGTKSPQEEADQVAVWWWESLDPKPVRAGSGTSSGFPGFRNLIRGARRAGFTQHEIGKALLGMRNNDGTVWPSTQQLDRACRSVRAGQVIGARAPRPGQQTRHVDNASATERDERRAKFEGRESDPGETGAA